MEIDPWLARATARRPETLALETPDGRLTYRELLMAARDLWLTFPEAEDERERTQIARAAFRLLHLANIVSVTTSV